MSDLGYLVWLVVSALATITILTVTTLASAGLLRRHPAPEPERPTALPAPRAPAGEVTGSETRRRAA